ncbi:hypothetical protein HELRODRAFT_162395 [Helobdella robusta]|uniref:Uncharacterized protein n=1 Tax=Helobdella robusta TaxID=6412 RepID=T1ESL6_HELRO|nr:hypothetical protein HELRODRAFT_162395 [Helobdella robusta]ESN98925.1 hypothetical protein HELRODRAFT_162395 [Helobdella robusta]
MRMIANFDRLSSGELREHDKKSDDLLNIEKWMSMNKLNPEKSPNVWLLENDNKFQNRILISPIINFCLTVQNVVYVFDVNKSMQGTSKQLHGHDTYLHIMRIVRKSLNNETF